MVQSKIITISFLQDQLTLQTRFSTSKINAVKISKISKEEENSAVIQINEEEQIENVCQLNNI